MTTTAGRSCHEPPAPKSDPSRPTSLVRHRPSIALPRGLRCTRIWPRGRSCVDFLCLSVACGPARRSSYIRLHLPIDLLSFVRGSSLPSARDHISGGGCVKGRRGDLPTFLPELSRTSAMSPRPLRLHKTPYPRARIAAAVVSTNTPRKVAS